MNADELLPGSRPFARYSLGPGGRVIAGTTIDPRGEFALVLSAIDEAQGRMPARPDGRIFRPVSVGGWLDTQRLVFWDHELRSAVIWDARRNESRLLPDIPGPAQLVFTDGGRKLFLARSAIESDIWMLTLAEDAGAR